jgi:putative tributyrin esterase
VTRAGALGAAWCLAASLAAGCRPRAGDVDAGAPAEAASSAPVASSSPVAPDEPEEHGEVLTRSLEAPSLGVAKSYVVWLPPGYARSARRYPVVYLLHSLGGSEVNWVHHGKLRETADAMKLAAIVVMPDADDGFYTNGEKPVSYEACLAEKPPFSPAETPASYCVRSPRYEDYLARDVVGAVDATYRTIADAKHRALVGAGMGGFGAWMLALRHPDVFGVAASHSGFVALTWAAKHPLVAGAKPLATSFGDERLEPRLWPPGAWGRDYPAPMRQQLRRVFGDDLETWRAHDPAVLVEKLTPDRAPKLYLDAGTEDTFRVDDQARYVHTILERAGVAHHFELAHGPHLFSLWRERLPKSLAFVADAFAGR